MTRSPRLAPPGAPDTGLAKLGARDALLAHLPAAKILACYQGAKGDEIR